MYTVVHSSTPYHILVKMMSILFFLFFFSLDFFTYLASSSSLVTPKKTLMFVMLRKKLDTNREMSNVVSTLIFLFSIPWFFLSHLVNKCVAHHLTAINLLVSFYFNLVYVRINLQIHLFGIFSTFQHVFIIIYCSWF